jgi:hypothetical protein
MNFPLISLSRATSPMMRGLKEGETEPVHHDVVRFVKATSPMMRGLKVAPDRAGDPAGRDEPADHVERLPR